MSNINSYPLPLKPLFKLLALHPDSVVRISVARKLGRSKNIEVIPYLVSALNDKGSVTRSHPMERWNAHYFYVADSAAEALAAIGTEECISIIKERLYNADGSISIELSLERLQQWTELKLRTYEARRILQQNGLLSLLPLMGHLNNVELSMIDPIAEAIIYHQKNMGGDFIPQLLHYLSNSEDTLSRRWVLIILGTIGDVHVEEILNKFLSKVYEPLIRDGAVRGLGLLISKNLDVHDEQEILSKFITGLGEIPASSYCGVGWGVAEIVRAYADVQSPNALSIIQAILDYFFQGNLENSKSALDALESIYIKIKQSYIKNSETKQELDAFFELKVMPILIESPSYLMKLANHLVVEGDSSTNIDEAIGAFIKVIVKKENPPAWALHYTESDWIQLGCSDIEIQYKLGDILYEASRYRESLERYEKVLKLFDRNEYQNQYLLSLFYKSLNKVGLLHIYFEEFRQAIEFFRQITDLKGNPAVDDYLLLNAWSGLQRAYSEEKQWLELIETAMEALNLADKTYGRYLDRCSVRINIGSAYAELGEFEKALVCWQEAENLADSYGLHGILVELIFRRASLYFTLGREDLVESDFEKAESYYKTIEDWSEAANVLGQLSEKVFKDDPVRRISVFQKALSYLDLLQSPLERHDHAFFFYKVALAYQELNDSSNAELNFQKALSALEKQKISELEAYIWIDFGRFLHEIGRTKEGEKFAMRGVAIQAELGIDESYGEKALREMSSNPEWRIPSAILFIMFNTIINSLTTGSELTDEVLKRLEGMLNRARDQGWKEEEELLISLHSITSGRMSKLLETNPYFEPFSKFELELKNAIENKKM